LQWRHAQLLAVKSRDANLRKVDREPTIVLGLVSPGPCGELLSDGNHDLVGLDDTYGIGYYESSEIARHLNGVFAGTRHDSQLGGSNRSAIP